MGDRLGSNPRDIWGLTQGTDGGDTGSNPGVRWGDMLGLIQGTDGGHTETNLGDRHVRV